ncbi:MAG: hypothetical protein Q8942_17070, partial [Bacillota bacterium]|nr:hypothetical protein [Bacillota bacterium]
MLSAFYKKIASLCAGFKQIFTSWLKSIGISEAFSAQLKALEKILGVLVKILLYSLIPLFLIVILTIIFFSFVFRNTYKGVFYCIRGFDTAIAFFKKKILSLENFVKNVLRRAKEFTANLKSKVIKHHGEQRNIFRRILSVLSKMFLYALVPPLFIFLLIIILLSKVMPYVNRWIAYGITALRAILVIIGETRSADDEGLDETIEFTGFKYDSEQD